MPIPRKTFPIQLKSATPTPLTAAALKQQLTDIGLTCPDSAEHLLEQYIASVKAEIPDGAVKAYAILKQAPPDGQGLQGLATNLTTASVGNWEPDGTGLGYGPELEYIQYEEHFEWLRSNRPQFTGIVNNPPTYTGRYDTIDSVKSMFANVATAASSTLIKGLDKDAVESVLSNAIAPLSDDNARNYDPGPDSRVIFLVDNYNPETQEADAIGVLTVWWHLTIKDYKIKKENPKHDTTLTVRARSVLYSSVEDLNADYLAAQTHFKENAFTAIPAKPTKVTIFDTRPPANADTFRQSLPKVATQDALEVIVLYAPNLQNIGSIDNTNSDTTTTYSKSVTSGFTFSTTQTLGVEAAFEASAEVVKAGFKVSFSISFTEQWSTTTTETMSFAVPPGKMAFTYQGYLMAQRLRYDAKTGSYAYQETAKFLTNILSTSATPLVDPT